MAPQQQFGGFGGGFGGFGGGGGKPCDNCGAVVSFVCACVCVCARACACVCVCDPEPETLDPKQGHLAAQCPSAPQCLNPEP